MSPAGPTRQPPAPGGAFGLAVTWWTPPNEFAKAAGLSPSAVEGFAASDLRAAYLRVFVALGATLSSGETARASLDSDSSVVARPPEGPTATDCVGAVGPATASRDSTRPCDACVFAAVPSAGPAASRFAAARPDSLDRKSTRLNSSH